MVHGQEALCPLELFVLAKTRCIARHENRSAPIARGTEHNGVHVVGSKQSGREARGGYGVRNNGSICLMVASEEGRVEFLEALLVHALVIMSLMALLDDASTGASCTGKRVVWLVAQLPEIWSSCDSVRAVYERTRTCMVLFCVKHPAYIYIDRLKNPNRPRRT